MTTDGTLFADGIHDDTAAIRWHLSQTKARSTYTLPPGKYRISEMIIVPDNIGFVVLDGAELVGDFPGTLVRHAKW